MKTLTDNKATAILAILRNRHFLKKETHVANLEFEAEISLNIEATEIFIRHLNASCRLKHKLNLRSNFNSEIIFDFKDIDADFILEDLDFAYQKAIQFLDYKDLKREYAAGYIPYHMSDWLIAQN